MDDIKNQSESLTDHAEALSDTFLKLVFINLTQKGVVLAAGLINTIFIYLASIFVLLFAAAGLAWWLGDVMNNHAAGFFIVAGIFLLIVFLIIVMRKKTIYPLLRNMLVRKIYE
ncbi:MAG: phage holin family protein [Bacteroidota bacterium]